MTLGLSNHKRALVDSVEIEPSVGASLVPACALSPLSFTSAVAQLEAAGIEFIPAEGARGPGVRRPHADITRVRGSEGNRQR
jgi:hypothetical protein